MIDWLVNRLLQAAGWVTDLWVAPNAPNFNVIQGMVAVVLIVVFVFGLFCLSARRQRRSGNDQADA